VCVSAHGQTVQEAHSAQRVQIAQCARRAQTGQAAWTVLRVRGDHPGQKHMNTPTVKQKIRDAVLDSLEELKNSDGVREVARRRDIVASASLVPALLYVDTGETEVDRDATGQTYEFDFYIKILVDKTKQQDQQKDDLVGSVQRKLEKLAVAGGFLKCGGEEKTSVTARFVFIEGPFVKFRVQYKRKCGEPETSY
jgi:hypothetical protein